MLIVNILLRLRMSTYAYAYALVRTMESQNCLMILIFIILGGYVIILGGYVIANEPAERRREAGEAAAL